MVHDCDSEEQVEVGCAVVITRMVVGNVDLMMRLIIFRFWLARDQAAVTLQCQLYPDSTLDSAEAQTLFELLTLRLAWSQNTVI